ncbi:DNA polymerase epsilon subunit D [Tolypocladium ophioglossoides CBS 100239]|uniref:DNA polymerase epsilon subunit D n=1 Tax=Tolypocladium ophioglossoides (strain CBS 100239) TaxID=1163406 RepID=A0A0L0N7Z2_TOLOC|nr:DNA polymerase epsilon subunit D [Tolypocladium ophioglossoides CBS 100239]
MPPRKSDQRKSDASVTVAAHDESVVSLQSADDQSQDPAAPSFERKDKDKDKDKDHRDRDAVTIEDLTLPKSIITRLAKGVLPPNTQIQANAILAMSKSATVFINYLASHANEHTTNAGKKTISPADVFKALDDTEFSFLREPLEAEFAKFNAIQTEKRTSYRAKARAPKGDRPKGTDTDMADHTSTTLASRTIASSAEPPRAKKPRVDPHDDAETEEEEDAEEPEEQEVDEDDEDDEVDEEEDDDEEEQGSGDETQDALEVREGREEKDEALDGDESD